MRHWSTEKFEINFSKFHAFLKSTSVSKNDLRILVETYTEAEVVLCQPLKKWYQASK